MGSTQGGRRKLILPGAACSQCDTGSPASRARCLLHSGRRGQRFCDLVLDSRQTPRDRIHSRGATIRSTKFRQAAFVYLHLAILYWLTVFVAWRHDMVPTRFGPPLLWLAIGAIVPGLIFVGLLRWQNVWLARIVWVIQAARLPAFIEGAFFAGDAARMPHTFYLMAIVVVLINLWMLARAAWDL